MIIKARIIDFTPINSRLIFFCQRLHFSCIGINRRFHFLIFCISISYFFIIHYSTKYILIIMIDSYRLLLVFNSTSEIIIRSSKKKIVRDFPVDVLEIFLFLFSFPESCVLFFFVMMTSYEFCVCVYVGDVEKMERRRKIIIHDKFAINLKC